MRISITFFSFFISQVSVYCMPSATYTLALSSETDKLALLALKEKLTNGVSDSLPSWNESLHFCEWQGVTCGRRHMRVSFLKLENQTLGGTLGPSIGNLTFLRILRLSNIGLHGEIPKQIGHLKRLEVLHLSNNHLRGEIPFELTNCTNIKVIYLASNHLIGRVPAWFGSMMQLIELNLRDNNLVGTIPSSLGNVSSLQNITLAYNHLEGSIPYSLGRITSLKQIIFGSNILSGEIPHSLYNLSHIQIFDLGENKLLGSLPSNLNLIFPNVQKFFIGDNQIRGTFPSSISNLSELQGLDISLNAFKGPIPLTLGRLNKLEIFDIGFNNFGSDLDFLSSLTNCTQLTMLILGQNKFGSKLPDLMGNLSINLSFIDLGVNQIYGVIPERIGQLIGLTYLDMGSNSLQGSIPNSIGKLKNLVRLVLQENKLSGNIPTSIGNLTILSELYLSSNKLEGSVPFFLRYCTQLQKLSIAVNKLSGDLPNQTFSYLDGLIYIYLHDNSLTGSIPSEFGGLKHLSQLYLDSNNLSGEIPKDLAACLALTELSLRGNSFHGKIPSFFGSLRSLEILDISKNNFSSTIPSELKNLTLLNTLNLSFNSLYGEVPIGGVFSNVTKISLIGNKNLCGGILQLKLPKCYMDSSKTHKHSLKKKLIIIIIIISVIVGVLISFIAFTIVHVLTRKSTKLPSSPSLQNRALRVTYGELHEATNGFSSSNLVGTGSFGSVYRGSLHNFERPIAVKVLNLETRGAAKCFEAECSALGKMKHRNLVKILTCCSSVDYKGEDFKAIVFEFMLNGSLENLLHDNEGSENHSLGLTQRVDIALDVAHALDYLHHDEDQVVVHCDIKPSNVLLDQEMVAHLGDFGLARLIHGSTGHSSKDQIDSSTIKGTIGYVPPEEYGAGGPVTPEGDIYSYGILLLEMLTGKRPTENMFYEDLSLHRLIKMKIPEEILDIVDSRLVIPFVEDQTKNNIKECLVMFAEIGVACSEEFPTQRMLTKHVILKLIEIKHKLSR
ncbi:unnamed protein product [Vicia faba]|uniref:non-specific serine/threonine protein kinase n=1 Tax=Vicia faba TaxID=3906 RepID=A0AAV0YNQ4_VICFA|nr:unnamed protein product [Vicia faba]